MLKKKFEIENYNWKINAIQLLLIISNIILFIGLIDYYSKVGINIRLEHLDDISAIIATMIILGFISVKLPKINDLGDHYFYSIVYLVIICIIGLMTSYFDSKLDTSLFFESYLDMFKILCGVLIFVLLATNLKSFKEIINGKFNRKNQLICLAIFIMVGLFASYAHVSINGTPANIRCLIVMISGLFGGPIVGIPVGIISGAYRYALGGPTALPCAISTVISGILGSLIFIWNNRKFPKTITAIILMFLFTGFEMLLVVLMTPTNISFQYIRNIYPIMLFASVVGMLLFSIVIREAKEKMNSLPSPEEQKIKEFEDKLESHVEIIEDLKNEIKELKKEKSGNEYQDEN